MADDRWALRVAAEYGACAAAFWLASLSPCMWLPAIAILGTRQHALGIIGHWAMHGLLPRWIMWVCYAPIAIDPRVYGASHALHHNNLGGSLDPETHVVEKYSERWGSIQPGIVLMDMAGMHADEAIDILRLLVSARSCALYTVIVVALYAGVGPLALLWPAGMGVMLASHRVRAHYEHDHLLKPGVTFRNARPPIWLRTLFLPHYAWMHYEHHADPRAHVWDAS